MPRAPLVTSLALLACRADAVDVAADTSTTETSTTSSTTAVVGTESTSADATSSETTTLADSSGTSSSETSDTGPSPAVCGDGIVEGDEECDDRNREADDGCDLACNHAGVLLWSIDWDGPGGADDSARGLAARGDGSFVVVGVESGVGTGGDAFVSLREPDGTETWRQTYDASGEYDEAHRVAIDSSGGIVAVGFTTTDDVMSLWLRRYDDLGVESWTIVDLGGDGIGAVGIDVASAPGDVLYVAGTWERPTGSSDAIVLEVDGQLGTVADTWVFSAGEIESRSRAIAFAGDVVLLTTEDTPTEGANAVLRRLDTTGNELWSTTERGDAGFTDESGHSVAIAGDGEIVVVGRVDRRDQKAEAWTARYDAAGAPLWSRTFHRSPNEDDVARSVALDDAGDVFLTGGVAVPGQQTDLFARRYAADGIEELWTSTWDDPDTHLIDEGYAIAVVADGVLVAGTTSVAGEGENATLRKYALER